MHKLIVTSGLLAGLFAAVPAQAQDRLLGEIFMTAANFCPRGSAQAAGQLLSISQNTALFSLLGTTYGGDGRRTFALPDLRGRFPIGDGTGGGLSTRKMGDMGGSEAVTLTGSEIGAAAQAVKAGEAAPVNVSGPFRGAQAHNNLPPYLAIRYCIAMQGIYPSRP